MARSCQYLSPAFLLVLGAFLLAPGPCRAAGLTVVLVDHLTLSEVLGALPAKGAIVALVSPGLPRGDDPEANLYAALTAGDVANTSNPNAGLLQRELRSHRAASDVKIVRFGPVDSPAEVDLLRGLIDRLRVNPLAGRASGVLVVGVTPRPTRVNPVEWDSLTPLVWFSCGGGTTDSTLQPTFTSDTTQTPGLLALRDIAPTVLRAEDIPIPDSMSGHPARLVELGAGADRDALLMSIDRITRLNQQSIKAFGWIFGLSGGVVLLAAVSCVLRRRRPALMPYAIRAVLAIPLALLATGLAPAHAPAAYLAELAVIAAILAAAARGSVLFGLSAAAILIDAVCGSRAISRSLISDYWLSGIRFYGIGNEYMGLLLGFALVAPFAGRRREWDAIKLALLAAWFFLVLFVLAYPGIGAKAGGAVTAMAAFAPCWWALARGGKPNWISWMVGVALGFAAIFLLAWIAHRLGGRATHIQAATSALASGHVGYITAVALRKARMAIKIALAPGALAGLAGVAIVTAIWIRSDLRVRVAESLEHRPDLRVAVSSGLWGMLAAVLFNDSGAVAALLLFGVIGLGLLHEMFVQPCESLPSMSEMSGSASPSATSSSSEPILSSP
jgi:hypothetical protein